MALGNQYNNNNQKANYQPTVYSGYNMSNSESKIDSSRLSFSYWNKLLKIAITPLKNVDTNGIPQWDEDNTCAIHLSHTKARMLFDEICMFQNDVNAYNNVGVSSGSGLISITSGKEMGVSNPCLIIRKLNGNDGSIEASVAYEFKQDYHYAIRNFDESTSDFDKVYNNNLEIEQLKTLLKSYYEAMTGAIAYSVIDNSKYDNSRLNTKINAISEKLGIEYGNGNNRNQKSSTSIFNNKEGRNFSTSTLDDIESQLG